MNIITHPLYLAPVPLYARLYSAEQCIIDAHTPFTKQTFRNRAMIATERGVQALTIPVVHDGVQAMRDVRISEHGKWRHLHWNAILSAYKKSPFFDYYADDFAHFYEERDGFLMDFNLRLHSTICELIGLDRPIAVPEKDALERAKIDAVDVRDLAEPTVLKDMPAGETYYQVFAGRNGFIANLSILDLLFNMGPEGLITLSQWRF